MADETQAPEDLAPPAPDAPAAPPEELAPHKVFAPDASGAVTEAGKSLAPIVGGVLGYLAQTVEGHPIEQAVFGYAKAALAGGTLDTVAAQIGLKGPLTVKGIVDGMFTYLVSVEKRPVVQFATRGLQAAFDYAGLPLLQAYLVSLGFPLPLS